MFIKDTLRIFHGNIYNEDIRKITYILEEIENNQVENLK